MEQFHRITESQSGSSQGACKFKANAISSDTGQNPFWSMPHSEGADTNTQF